MILVFVSSLHSFCFVTERNLFSERFEQSFTEFYFEAQAVCSGSTIDGATLTKSIFLSITHYTQHIAIQYDTIRYDAMLNDMNYFINSQRDVY